MWQGNNNRFLSAEECSNTCQHWARQRETELTCSSYLEPGSCPDLEGSSSTLARWGFDPARRRCVPFYYAGCGGNTNNFQTREECEELCPSSFSPLITLTGGSPQFFRRNEESQISVRIRANPEPTVQWRHNGRNITQFDYQVRDIRGSQTSPAYCCRISVCCI